MGYKRMVHDEVYDVFRRWHAGHSIAGIAAAKNRSRKTIRKYINDLVKAGFARDKPLPAKADMTDAIDKVLPAHKRMGSIFASLLAHEEELCRLINDRKEPVKPKTAFEIIQAKYGVQASYETFKIFCRRQGLRATSLAAMIRIEIDPGKETQIDYGTVGTLMDYDADRNRKVYAFCGVLSKSRLPFFEFVFTQDEQSFVVSHMDMAEFYGGTTEFYSLDNLKSGVIKPDLYDPTLNKAYAEMAEHYGVFLDPCRVGRSKDKAKVERLIPVARELFRKLKHIHPTADIHELNRHAANWCRNEYGRREHGTTGLPPLQEFEETERACLRPLPAERFEVPIWKKAVVHPDQFITAFKMRFSLPPEYRKEEVWVRKTNNILRIFFKNKMLRQYVLKAGQRVYYQEEDFPAVIREMMHGGYPKYLLEKAKQYGEHAFALVEKVLSPHAYLNARRAQGFLAQMEKYCGKPFFENVCTLALERGVKLPAKFRDMLQFEEAQLELPFKEQVHMSEVGQAMTRPPKYYIN